MLKLGDHTLEKRKKEKTLVNLVYQLTRIIIFLARAETVESTSSTVEDGGRKRLLRRASVARVNTRLQRYVGQLPNRTAALLIFLL